MATMAELSTMLERIMNSQAKSATDTAAAATAAAEKAAALAMTTLAETNTKMMEGFMATMRADSSARAETAKASQEQQPQSQPSKTTKPETVRLDLRNFTNFRKFSGGEHEWSEWQSDFRTIVVSINPGMDDYFKSSVQEETRILDKEGLKTFYHDVNINREVNIQPEEMHLRSK